MSGLKGEGSRILQRGDVTGAIRSTAQTIAGIRHGLQGTPEFLSGSLKNSEAGKTGKMGSLTMIFHPCNWLIFGSLNRVFTTVMAIVGLGRKFKPLDGEFKKCNPSYLPYPLPRRETI